MPPTVIRLLNDRSSWLTRGVSSVPGAIERHRERSGG